MTRIAVIMLALFLGGCGAGSKLGSITGGEAKVFEAPPYEVLGKTRYDQNVIDNWVEGGVAAFGWKRPAERPAELDAPANRAPKATTAVKPVKKPGLVKRIKAKITGKPLAATPDPVPFVDDPPPPAPPPPPPKPRRPIDELLNPSR